MYQKSSRELSGSLLLFVLLTIPFRNRAMAQLKLLNRVALLSQ
jgi:hypothetical protein